MSLELYAFLPEGRLPGRAQWQAALDALALPLRLDDAFDPAEAGGFTPMTLAGRATGCEIDLEDADSVIESFPLLAGPVQPTDAVLCFRAEDRPTEAACILAAIAALVADRAALFFDPADDTLLDRPDELAAQARTLIAGLR